jgi:hypothetical protein
MKPQKLSIEAFTEGDEWEGIPAISITVGPEGGPFAPPANPLAEVTMRFKKSTDIQPNPIVELSSATPGQINITNAANWTFTIPAQIVAGLTFGKWKFRIRCKDNSTSGKPKTYLADEVDILETI